MRLAHKGRWLLGVLFGTVLLGGGCTRPQFKVKVTGISEGTQSLQVHLWLANPDYSSDRLLNTQYTSVIEETSTDSLMKNMPIDGCMATNKDCIPDQRQFDFGVNYPSPTGQTTQLALIGLAAVGSQEGTSTPQNCLVSVTTGQISNPVSFGVPDTLEVRMPRGQQVSSACVTLDSVPAGVATITDVSIQLDARKSGDSSAVIPLVVVNGWGFKPESKLEIVDACNITMTTGNIDNPPKTPTAAQSMPQLLLVTPTQIVSTSGNLMLATGTCGVGMSSRRSVAVVNSAGKSQPFQLP